MPRNKITEQEIYNFLQEIESGSVILSPRQEPQGVYACYGKYDASNGWEITIYSDANEWDYIDEIRTGDGREIEYSSMAGMPRIDGYRPSKEMSWDAYGIPGYCKFRCTACGSGFKYRDDSVFKCPDCR
jgi:hypothetical protein